MAAPISMSVDHFEAAGKLAAGNLAGIETRKLHKGDCVCSNEETFYPPLCEVKNALPAYTTAGHYARRPGDALVERRHARRVPGELFVLKCHDRTPAAECLIATPCRGLGRGPGDVSACGARFFWPSLCSSRWFGSAMLGPRCRSTKCRCFACEFALHGAAPAKTTKSRSAQVRFEAGGPRVPIVGSGWSPWLAFDRAVAEATLKRYPATHQRGFPVVVRLRFDGLKLPAAVEGQLELGVSSVSAVKLRGELAGSAWGLLLWHNDDHAPRAATMAEYNKRYSRDLDRAKLAPEQRPRQFILADRFVGGDDDRLAWRDGIESLASIGLTTLALPPTKLGTTSGGGASFRTWAGRFTARLGRPSIFSKTTRRNPISALGRPGRSSRLRRSATQGAIWRYSPCRTSPAGIFRRRTRGWNLRRRPSRDFANILKRNTSRRATWARATGPPSGRLAAVGPRTLR